MEEPEYANGEHRHHENSINSEKRNEDRWGEMRVFTLHATTIGCEFTRPSAASAAGTAFVPLIYHISMKLKISKLTNFQAYSLRIWYCRGWATIWAINEFSILENL
jgi:hypothetical protein